MFFRRAKGLFDFSMALLCVGAALHLTPVGALVRKLGATLVGERSTSGPLLSYYSGGGDPAQLRLALPERAQIPVPGQLSPAQALAYGTSFALAELAASERSGLEETASRYGFKVPGLVARDGRSAREVGALLGKVRANGEGEELAVATLFFGIEAARYARERCEASGEQPSLEALVAKLPPGFEGKASGALLAMALRTAYGLSWPVSRAVAITSAFGEREHPILGGRRMHEGVDLGMPVGSLVRASGDGIVRRASEDPVNGKLLVIDHGHGITTTYLHNSRLRVAEGAHVARGEVISESGNTGRSSGPHLHYQLELGQVPVDPLRFALPVTKREQVAGANDG